MSSSPVAVFDTKSYDRQHLTKAPGADGIDWRFFEFRLSPDTVPVSQGMKAICVFVNDHCDREILTALAEQGVKMIALRCAGFNNVDVAAAKELGISVTRVPSYSPHAVAEHTVGLILALNRKIHRAYNRVRELNFALAGLTGFDLHGKTAGIYGTGKIGRITAQILRGFGMRVLAYDPFPNEDWASANGVEYVSDDLMVRESDLISLHAPLTPDTQYFVRDETVVKMKPGVYIVNVSRGKLIDTTALIKGLKSKQIGGVALDVYEEEEGVFFEDLSGEVLADDELARLLTFPNVLITAHQAFLTEEALGEIARVTVENLRRYASGDAFLENTSL